MKNTSTAALKKLVCLSGEYEKIIRFNKDLSKALSKTGQRTYIRHFWGSENSRGIAQTEIVRNIDFVELKKALGLKRSVITKVYVDNKKKTRIDLFFVALGQGAFIDQR